MIVPPVPSEEAVSAPFWDATRTRRLVFQRCDDCAAPVWYPRAVCPTCLSGNLTWTESTGRGIVYSVSVHYRAPAPELADSVPYAVALVDLDDGPRMLTNVVDCSPEAVRIGDPVLATWRALPDGRHLLQFAPDPDGPLAEGPTSQ